MIDTLFRQWSLLRLIPRYPRRLDPASIKAQLDAQGIEVTLRTVQRDLNALAAVFPLEATEGRPQGWRWCQGARQIDIPSMDPHAALTFYLVEQHLRALLPPTTLDNLTPWFEAARGVVSSGASRVTQWKNKVRVVARTLTKVAPAIDPAIQASLYDGLLRDRQIEVSYRALTTGGEAKTYPVHPLGLVVMEQVVYLVCTLRDYQDPRFLAIHRIDTAQVLDLAAKRPKGFDIDAFITQEFGIRLGAAALKLVLKVRGTLAAYLAETPIAPGQKIKPLAADWREVRVKVADTQQLRNWLGSLGPNGVVLAPAGLREEMRATLRQLAALYDEPAPGQAPGHPQ
jgi:predicted DNA-binding transcriptional regulator YafY